MKQRLATLAPMAFETAMEQWQAGERRLEEAPFDEQPVLEIVTREVYAELRRRLGSTFTTEELADLYDAGTGWVADVAIAAAPESPFAWDVRVVGDAAFARYLREAVDFAGRPAAGVAQLSAAQGGRRPGARRGARRGPGRKKPVHDPRPPEPQPRVEVLRGAVRVGEEEREVLARLLRRARDDRVGEPASAVRRASCRRARPRRRAAWRAAGTSTTGRPPSTTQNARAPVSSARPRSHASIAATASSVPHGSARIHSARSGQITSGSTSSTAARRAGGGLSSAISRWRLTCQPAAANAGATAAPIGSCSTSTAGWPGKRVSAANAMSPARTPCVVSTRTTLTSRTQGTPLWNTAVPQGRGSVHSATASSTAHRCATMRSRSVVVVLVAAGAADHDLVLLDRDLDGTVARPVLGVHGVVLDGGVEPQPVALLAVVERPLERAGAPCARRGRGPARVRAWASRPAPRPPRRPPPRRPCARPPRRPWPPPRRGGPPRPRARRRSLASSSARRSTSSVAAPSAGLAVGLQAVLALERLDLLDGHLELVGDPRVGATLSHPPSDLVKLRTQRPAAHEQAGRLAKAFGCWPHGARDAVAVRSAEAQFGAISSGVPGHDRRTEWQGGASCSY